MAYGQKPMDNLQFKRIDTNYTWRKATPEQIDSFYYNLMPIYRSHFQIHIRISLSGQIIDLFTNDNIGILEKIVSLQIGNN